MYMLTLISSGSLTSLTVPLVFNPGTVKPSPFSIHAVVLHLSLVTMEPPVQWSLILIARGTRTVRHWTTGGHLWSRELTAVSQAHCPLTRHSSPTWLGPGPSPQTEHCHLCHSWAAKTYQDGASAPASPPVLPVCLIVHSVTYLEPQKQRVQILGPSLAGLDSRLSFPLSLACESGIMSTS